VFDALAQVTALTAVTLGTLPLGPPAAPGAPPPPAPPPPGARLPRVKRLSVAAVKWLASRHPWHELSQERQRLMGLDGTHAAAWADALCAFPGLEALSFDTAGAARPDTLARLPAAAPGLRELALPPRLVAGDAEAGLAALGRMTALARLRVGWKAALNEGPPAGAQVRRWGLGGAVWRGAG
jgi:hypothetical protein